MRSNLRLLSSLVVLLFLAAVSTTTFAAVHTTVVPKARVTSQVDNTKRVTLYGHVPSALLKAKDMGRLDPKTPAEHLILVLKSSEEQKREIRRIIDEQQDQRTANYHQWVTPEEFGAHFGVHDNDIAQVKAWLKSQGFTVEDVSKSKRVIRFSGTTGQLESAFQTEMHSLLMPNGETHVSNNREISVPEALSPVIAGISLHNFFSKNHLGPVQHLSELRTGPKFGPGGNSGTYVGPADFATIYNTNPLLQSGIDGTGVTIAIVGRSDILMSDVQTYRQMFNLPVNDPTFINAGQDNGIEPGDDGESDLDVEISGGVAPNAKIKFVVGTPTFLVDGITNSIQYIVENNLADIMSISYGSCESVEGVGGNEFNNQAFEQAAAQGISVFVAAGDNGPAQCDASTSSTETGGYATGAEESTPYNVSVGGTQFDDSTGVDPTYWSATNNPLHLNSALSYIPEYPWNESRAADATKAVSGLSGLWSGSGGISAYYLKPSWQQGPGVPSVDPTLAGGEWLTGVTITNVGSGYTSNPTVAFTGGGCITEPTATATEAGGSLATFTVTKLGFGCTSAPAIGFSGGGGTGAAATATVGPMQNIPPLTSGVPHRYTPDLALPAAAEHEGTLFCSEGVCEISPTGALLDAGIVGGTSVAAPAMAGVQALINQANGGRQGMPGYIYYTLAAAQSATNCNSNLPPLNSSNCAFQDITIGDNLICGVSGSSCTASTPQNKIGFLAGTGYDMASGLGSPNAANLASQWSTVIFTSSATTLNVVQSGTSQGSSVTFSGQVTSVSGTPSGDVAFILSQGAFGNTVNVNTGAFNAPGAFATLDGGGNYTASLTNLPGGTYTVSARYAGDSTFASSLSTAVPVTVNQGGTTVTITPQFINQSACTIVNQSTFTYGQFIWAQVTVAGTSGQGKPTGTVTITDGVNTIGTVTLDSQGNGYLAAGSIPTNSCIYDYMFAQSPTLSGGSHSIGASYSGDSTFTAAVASPVTITVNPLSAVTTLVAGGTLITSGFGDQLTATLTSPPNTGLLNLNGSSSQTAGPTGTVTFTDTTTSIVLGTASVVPAVAFSGNVYTFTGTAVLNTTGITVSGANSITASYSGDTNYVATNSTAVTVTVNTGTATTTTVTSSSNPSALNGRPTFTATITGAPTAGTVTFYDGTTVLGVGTVGSGHTATFRPASGAAIFAGTHNITATFGGSTTGGTFLASTSSVLVETVNQGTNTITLTAKTVGKAGQTYTFSAVLAGTPTAAGAVVPNLNNVQFFDGGTNIGSAQAITFTSGQGGYGLWAASLTTSALTAGSHTITAQYSDINWALATSNAQTIFVGGSPTLAWATPAAIIYGTPLSATQLDATDTIPGTYVYTPAAGSVLNAGTPTLSVTFKAADYTDFPTPQTTTVPLQVNKAATSIAVTSVSPASEVYGQDAQVTITAVLSWAGSGTAPTASAVTISGNVLSSTFGTTSCGAPSGTTMTCTNTYTPTVLDAQGTYTMSAAFSGDTNYTGSTSPQTNNFSITQASAAVTVGTSVNPSVFGQSVTFTATINGQYGLVKGRDGVVLSRVLIKGRPQPLDITGTVTWSSNTGCGTTSVTTGNPGTATCTTSSLAVGSETITATYSGDGNHAGGTGTLSPNQQVNQASANALVGSTLNPSTYGQAVSFSANVTAVSPGAGSPTGTVQFAIDSVNFGSPVTLSAGSASSGSISTLTVATHTVTATYSGDTNFQGVTGTLSGGQVVNQATAGTSVTSSLNPSAYAQSVTFTATINGEYGLVRGQIGSLLRGRPQPQDVTGTVTWSSNTACGTTSVTSGNPGTATCTTTVLPLGNNTITAAYSGDGNHSGSTGTLPGGQVVNEAHQTITFTTSAPASAAYNSSFTVVATASSGLPVAFTSAGSCTNVGPTYTMTNSTGTCSVIANQAGNSDYFPAPTVTQTTHATKATQTVSFTGAPPTAQYGTNFTVVATSTAPITPSITVSGPCSIAGTTVTMTSGKLTCTMTATWPGNSLYLVASAKQTTIAELVPSVITWAAPSPIPYGTPLSATQLDATANDVGSFTYSPAAGKVLVAGTYTLSVTFKPANASDYSSATDSVTLVVNPVNTTTTINSNVPNPSMTGKAVTVHFTVTEATDYKAPTGSVTVNASTGESCTGNLAAGSGSCKITFSTSGTRTLTATYSGDSNDNTSVSTSVSQTVN
jgi:hypothetical protein